MDSGKAGLYDHAGEWLRQTRDAYRVMGSDAEWQAYKKGLLMRHGRKYRLVPLLERL